jgi:hypothetical protein
MFYKSKILQQQEETQSERERALRHGQYIAEAEEILMIISV